MVHICVQDEMIISFMLNHWTQIVTHLLIINETNHMQSDFETFFFNQLREEKKND